MFEAQPPATQLMMRRADLADLPEWPVPAGYSVRRATAADAPGIAAVMAAAFGPDYGSPNDTEQVFARLLLDPNVRTTFVAVSADGTVAASGSAAYMPARFGDVGYVHWIAADPEHSGRGLGTAITLAVLREFVALGLVAAVLQTDDHRIPAIRTYLKLGFLPFLHQRNHPDRWADVTAQLASPNAAGAQASEPVPAIPYADGA